MHSLLLAHVKYGTPQRGVREPGRVRNEEQARHDDDGSDEPRDAMTRRCQAFGGDGCRHEGHGAEVHDSNDEENHDEPHTALAAVETESQAISPRLAALGRWHLARARRLPAA